MTQPKLLQFQKIAMTNSLRSCKLFAGLSDEELSPVTEWTIIKTIEKGEYLFHEGEPSEGFYVIQKGAINLHRVSPAGKEQVIQVFRAGDSFAEASLDGMSGYPGSARALESTSLLLVPKVKFIELLSKRPDLGLRMLSSMSMHLRVLVGMLDDLTLKDVETRLAHWLLKKCPKQKMERSVLITLEMTKRILAAEIGTTSETLSRTLGEFRKLELIKVNGKTIEVSSPRKLEELLKRNLGEK